MRNMMHRLIDSFSPAYLEPMTLSELYQRMCMNLVGPSAQLPTPQLHTASPDARNHVSHRNSCFPGHCCSWYATMYRVLKMGLCLRGRPLGLPHPQGEATVEHWMSCCRCTPAGQSHDPAVLNSTPCAAGAHP